MPERSPYDTSPQAQREQAFAAQERRMAEQQRAEAARRAAAAKAEKSGAIYPWEREQQAARESIRARSEAAQQRGRTVSPADAAAMRAQKGFADKFQLLGMRSTSKVDRPFYQPTKEFTDKMQGGYEEQVVMDPETGQPQVRQRIDPRTGEPMVDASGQPLTEIVTEQVYRPGLLEQQRAADEQVMQAKVQREAQVADVLTEQNKRQEMALVDMQARQKAQADRQLAQIDKMQQANQAAQNAADAFSSAPSLETFMQSKTAGQRIRIALAAGMLGAAGRNPMEMIAPLMQNELDVAKSNLALRQQKLGVRQQQVQQERNLYGDIMAQVQDERMADAIYQKSMLEAMRSEAQAKLAQAGVQVLSAEQQATMAALDQQIAAKEMEIGKVVEANTPMVTVSRSPFNPAQRRMIEKAGLEGLERSSEAQKIGLQQAGAERLEGMKAAATGDKEKFQQRKYIEKESREFRTEKKLIEEFMSKYKDDIPGMAFGVGWTPERFQSDEAAEAYDRLNRIIMLRLRRESGAKISDEEIELEAKRIIDSAVDEDDIRNDLTRRLDEANYNIDLIERAPGESAVESFTRSRAAPRAPLATGGAGLPDPVNWE